MLLVLIKRLKHLAKVLLMSTKNKEMIKCLVKKKQNKKKHLTLRKHAYIILTPIILYFHIVNLRFTGVYIIFVISAQKHRLWVLVRTASMRQF